MPPVRGPRGRSLRDLPRGLVPFGGTTPRAPRCAARPSAVVLRGTGLGVLGSWVGRLAAARDAFRGGRPPVPPGVPLGRHALHAAVLRPFCQREEGSGRGDAVPCGGWVCRTGAPSVTGEVAIPCGGAADAPSAYSEGPRGDRAEKGTAVQRKSRYSLFSRPEMRRKVGPTSVAKACGAPSSTTESNDPQGRM